MANNTYRLRYLPLFYTDLEEKIKYIADKLQNPQAANDLLAAVESAILERVDVAESFEPYHYSFFDRSMPWLSDQPNT
jgi:toxin ParE1/3/4